MRFSFRDPVHVLGAIGILVLVGIVLHFLWQFATQ
jgi:hypothetical protein